MALTWLMCAVVAVGCCCCVAVVVAATVVIAVSYALFVDNDIMK